MFVEDWLIEEYELPKVENLRIIPTEIVTAAYGRVLRESRKFKPLEEFAEKIATYALENPSECLASGVSDYMTNGAGSAILSIMIWRRLKEELAKMLFVPGELKVYKMDLLVILAIAVPIGAAIGYFLRGGSTSDDDINNNSDDDKDNYNGDNDSDGGDGGD